jgi:hypothetical protein
MSTIQSPQSDSRRQLLRNSGIGAVMGALLGYFGGRISQREMTCLDAPLPDDATNTERAMRRLVDTLNDYEQSYLHQGLVAPSEREIAEGYRYLLHLLTAGIELFVEGTPSHPQMTQIVSPTRKLMGDNADAYYFHASIAADGQYRVYGRNTGETYLSLTVHSAAEPGGWATGVVGALNNQQFATDGEGSWEVLLGQVVSGPNTIRTTPDTVSVISRHYYLNKTYAAADPNLHPRILIERLDAVPPPALPTDAVMATKISALEKFIRANSIDRPLMNPLSTPDWFSLIPNQLGKPAVWTAEEGGGGWGAVDNAYAAGIFRLKPDEALVIKGVMPKCVFANVLLWNKYLQSFDYRYRQVSLNKAQMELAEDGSFTIVVAHRDPGVTNWLDTEGRESGIVYWRFMLPTGEIAPFETSVVALADVQSDSWSPGATG